MFFEHYFYFFVEGNMPRIYISVYNFRKQWKHGNKNVCPLLFVNADCNLTTRMNLSSDRDVQ